MKMTKTLRLFLFALSPLLLVAGCADEPSSPKKDDRLGGSAGVTFASHDMSRVAPTRANTIPPN